MRTIAILYATIVLSMFAKLTTCSLRTSSQQFFRYYKRMNPPGFDRALLRDTVRKHESLWVIKNPNYRNRNVLAQEWMKVKEEIKATESVEELRKRWKALRDSDRKKLQRIKRAPSGSAGGGNVYKSEIEWVYNQEHYRKQSDSDNIATTSGTTLANEQQQRETTTIDESQTNQDNISTLKDSSAEFNQDNSNTQAGVAEGKGNAGTSANTIDENRHNVDKPTEPNQLDFDSTKGNTGTSANASDENRHNVSHPTEQNEFDFDSIDTQSNYEPLSQFVPLKPKKTGNHKENFEVIETYSDEEPMNELFHNSSPQSSRVKKTKSQISKAKQDKLDNAIMKSVNKLSKNSKVTKALHSDPNYNYCMMLVQHMKYVPAGSLIQMQKEILSVVEKYQIIPISDI